MDTAKIELTICIPAYKAAATIGDTLKSLEIQTDPNFNVLVIEDGPPDPIMHEEIMKHSQNLALSYEWLLENGGCGHARNVGIDKCKTKYIAFLDADDLYMPYAVDQINQAIRYHFDWYAGKFLQRAGNGFVIMGNNHNTWIHGRVYNVEFLKYHKIQFPEDIRISEDLPFNVLCREFGVEVRECDLPVSMYRPNDSGLTRQKDSHQKQAAAYVEANMHYIKTALRQRSADKLTQLPQVIVMCYYYIDYARYKGWDCLEKMEKDYQELMEYIKLPQLLCDDKFSSRIRDGLLVGSRPYPDYPEPPHETFWSMVSRLDTGGLK